MTTTDKGFLGNLENLRGFVLERVLNEDPVSHFVTLLGTLPSPVGPSAAIVRIERLPFPSDHTDKIIELLQDIKFIESTDIYSWLLAWFTKHESLPDAKINIICPATETHIRKYSKQLNSIVQETPELYATIVKPYIQSFPASRTQWVTNILTGVSEADKVLYRDDTSIEGGFLILPDMKWDLINVSTLYLTALTLKEGIYTLRDLRREHLPMLRGIRREATRIVKERWGLDAGSLRFYVHYQPSYYHFHVHIVNANFVGIPGMSIGQAHLLEDLISLIELSPPEGPTLLEKMTFTYGLGEQHGLFESLKAAQKQIH
ncbi:scavenger mRNA decapping enzyme [Pyrrhoderma noxium]|uniref:Scavenger mRNA decapping enzyme n=1 Tax=Pyrrhoderma noxium TaxID=2282107 RepID=A0A286UVF5_9AGAM|nr:scavenger mRNA decapping enzyme [Pyrrhoderma noxium]